MRSPAHPVKLLLEEPLSSPPAILAVDLPVAVALSLRAQASVLGLDCALSTRSRFDALLSTRTQLCCLVLDADEHALSRLRELRKLLHGVPVVICGWRLPTALVVGLVRLGARDVIDLAAPAEDVARRLLAALPLEDERGAIGEIVGTSLAIQQVRRAIRAAARTTSTVLVTGPTGSGKGLVARAIHLASERRERPFVAVDCGALAASLVESELFGHERGAFTGAAERRTGRFEAAADGTVFLDEIGDLDLPLQRKLLRVLQDRAFERIGGTRTISMRARVIAATHRDLASAVEEGAFRLDLLYRLNVVHVDVPPLRERLEDLPALVDAGLREISERLGVAVPPIDESFLDALAEHDWPGNVRELMHALERLVVRWDGSEEPTLRFDPRRDTGVLARTLRAPAPPLLPLVTRASAEDEKARLVVAMQRFGGNVARAARHLGLARSTLRYRLKRAGIQPTEPDDDA